MYIGADIKDLRNKLGVKQDQLADLVGTTVYTIRYWEQHPESTIKENYKQKIREHSEQHAFDENE